VKIVRRLVISGRVQGVWYRESMRIEAERLGVAGWVRNRAGGTVEAVVHGDEDAVAAIIAWAWRGPPAAEVSHIEISEDSGEYSIFERRPSE
jgi:acylphosphatase